MGIRIALAGNPNCGKTTLFNELTGANQYVGNWPGVTVEKKEGKYTRNKDIAVIDLPGIYSLSPYTPEEIVARDYLLSNEADVVINVVDATNLERNLYLTTQILELGLPVVLALNMMDLVEKNGDQIDLEQLSQKLGCPVVTISALKAKGTQDLVQTAVQAVESGHLPKPDLPFAPEIEELLSQVETLLGNRAPAQAKRWYAIKFFENEQRTMVSVDVPEETLQKITALRDAMQAEREDSAESIITIARYETISAAVEGIVHQSRESLNFTQKVDRVITSRILGLPIFVAVMFFVYWLAISVGTGIVTDWANDGLMGDGFLYTGRGAYEQAVADYESQMAAAEATGDMALVESLSAQEPDPSDGSYGLWIPGLGAVIGNALTAAGVAPWLYSLVMDGVLAGVGAVIGFIPQMIILFLLLGILELCGYMARVAFIMDGIFRRFGLSGKSFIPMLVASGCGVPAVMATKTIESERDRRMTIMTTTMIPCGAKFPLIALVFGALAGGNSADIWWVAPLFYFMGVLAVIVSAIILKKTKAFVGSESPFVMELPQYRIPAAKSVLLATWERVKDYVVRAGTVIFLSTIVLWMLMNFGFYQGQFGMLDPDAIGPDYLSYSLLASLGNLVSWIFAPLGFGSWEATAASVAGLVGKENIVASVSILTQLGQAGETDPVLWQGFLAMLGNSTAATLSFCAFNLLCAPCVAAMGAIASQMKSAKWTAATIAYLCGFAWCVGLLLYQFVGLAIGEVQFGAGTVLALVVTGLLLFQIVRPTPRYEAKTIA